MSILRAICIAAALLVGVDTASAQVVMPPASSLQLAGGKLDLGGADVQIGGTLGMGAGAIANAKNISIAAGGLLDAGSGAIGLFGDWSNLGTFTAGTSQVNFSDGGLAQSVFAGSTTFSSAEFISTTGKSYIFPVGFTQFFGTSLTILGTAAQGIQFRSATPGQVTFVDLVSGGAQNIDFVGVSNVHSTGQILAPTKNNDGGAGDDVGWFAAIIVQSTVPAATLSLPGMLLFALTLLAIVWHSHRYRRER